ncbi:MAG: cyanophycinase [Gemmatimonadaceae bacterium]|nr:cyanophycinase [Gemmatimonadaceae bacterium]
MSTSGGGARKRRQTDATGTLVLVGGALSTDGEVFREFLDLVGKGQESSIIGFTSASADVSGMAEYWKECFNSAGGNSCEIPIVETREQASDPAVVGMVDKADGIFLGGGDQVKLVSVLSGCPVGDAIRRAYERGAVICGTSAGAAALTETTLAGNELDEEGQLVAQYIGPGLGLLGFHTLIDTHFSQRRRLYRLFVAIAEYPELMGLGIDEDTALIVRGEVGKVVGKGTVTFVDGRDVRFNNSAEMTEGRQLTLSALRVGVIGSNQSFNLRKRELVALLSSSHEWKPD